MSEMDELQVGAGSSALALASEPRPSELHRCAICREPIYEEDGRWFHRTGFIDSQFCFHGKLGGGSVGQAEPSMATPATPVRSEEPLAVADFVNSDVTGISTYFIKINGKRFWTGTCPAKELAEAINAALASRSSSEPSFGDVISRAEHLESLADQRRHLGAMHDETIAKLKQVQEVAAKFYEALYFMVNQFACTNGKTLESGEQALNDCALSALEDAFRVLGIKNGISREEFWKHDPTIQAEVRTGGEQEEK